MNWIIKYSEIQNGNWSSISQELVTNLRAHINRYKLFKTVAIFLFLTYLDLKQGIDYVYVMVDFTYHYHYH